MSSIIFEALIRDGALVRIGQGSRLDFFVVIQKKNHVFSGLLFLYGRTNFCELGSNVADDGCLKKITNFGLLCLKILHFRLKAALLVMDFTFW